MAYGADCKFGDAMNISKYFIFSAAIAQSASMAIAQDFDRSPQKNSWSGGNFGININHGKGSIDLDGKAARLANYFKLNDTFSKPDGTSLALRLGYDWQIERFVLGIATEYNTGRYSDGLAKPYNHIGNSSTSLSDTTSVLLKIGYVLGDEWMGYGIIGHTGSKMNIRTPIGYGNANITGATYGIGISYMINENWQAYGEYTATDFGHVLHSGDNIKVDLKQAKIGISYKF